VEAMRILYGPSVPKELSPNVEIAVDEPVVEEVLFITVTAKRHKGKDKALPFTNPQTSSQNALPLSAMVSRAPLPQPAKKAATKPTHIQIFLWRRFWLCTSLDLVQVPLPVEEALLTLVP